MSDSLQRQPWVSPEFRDVQSAAEAENGGAGLFFEDAIYGPPPS